MVTDVQAGSAAERAGLASGTVIVEANRSAVKNVEDLSKALDEKSLAKGVLLLVRTAQGSRFLVIRGLTSGGTRIMQAPFARKDREPCRKRNPPERRTISPIADMSQPDGCDARRAFSTGPTSAGRRPESIQHHIHTPFSSSLQQSRSLKSRHRASACTVGGLQLPTEKKPCCHVPPTKWECICGRSPRLRCSTATTNRRSRKRSAARAARSSPGSWQTTIRSASCWPRPARPPNTSCASITSLTCKGSTAAARQEAYDRLHAGVKVLRRALRKNRRDLRIAGDPRQPAERRKDARQLLLRRRRAAARQIQKLQFQGILLKKPLARLSRIAVRMTDAVGAAQDPGSHARQRGAAARSPRGVAPPGPARRRGSQIAAAAAGRYSPAVPRARGGLSCLHAAEPAAGGIDRKTICLGARRPLGPDPGGEPRPHAGGQQVRSRRGHRFSTYAYWWIRQTIRRRSRGSTTAFGPRT